MNIIRFYLFIFLTSSSLFSYSKIPDYSFKVSPQISDKYYSKVNKKISSVNDQLTKKSLKYLAKFQRQERKLQQKIQKLNPGNATNVFTSANDKYKEFSQKIKIKTADPTKIISGEYNPYLDSLGTSLSFLKQFNGISDKVKEPLASLNQLQSKLHQSEKIKEFIAERKNQIKELLSKYTKIPGSLKKEYEKLSKTAYYYSAQVKEYKEMLKDPKKVEQKALGILRELPAFQKFMKENGQLASLFRMSGNVDPAQSLAGLQTRSSIQAVIQQRVAAGGPNAMAVVQQNIAQAAGELNKLKDKVNKFGGGSSDIEMPDFRLNEQKTKKFLQRLEYTTDLQLAKNNNLLPSTANIGLGIGYKLDDKKTIGIGLSYKLGMGNIQHISFTSQGLGLRSYMDWKIKKQLYVSGGYEMNFNAAFKHIEQLKNYNAWQRSALMGVSKKYKISKKVKGNMKLLYDFLAYQHVPVSPPVVFRLGYNF
jgi:hypothetical protein